MAATKENPIILYDILNKFGQHWAFNPYKTRLNLNYKGIPYRVQWVKLEDIEMTMKAVGVPPTQKTTPQYTLPMIADPSSDPNAKPTYIAESFAIALYLDKKYPSPKYPAVFPIGTIPLQKMFVDHYFPTVVGPLYPLMYPRAMELLDESSIEYLYRSRPGNALFDPLPESDARRKIEEARENFGVFAQLLELNTGSSNGPFLMGDKVTFADFAVGGALFFLHVFEGDDGKVWKEVMTWQDGRWANLWKELEVIEKKSTGMA